MPDAFCYHIAGNAVGARTADARACNTGGQHAYTQSAATDSPIGDWNELRMDIWRGIILHDWEEEPLGSLVHLDASNLPILLAMLPVTLDFGPVGDPGGSLKMKVARLALGVYEDLTTEKVEEDASSTNEDPPANSPTSQAPAQPED